MGERLRAPAAKLFGKHEEEEAAGEEKIQSHLQSLRKVLAEFLEWRAADEKRRQDYLLERSEAAASPRAGKEPALLPPPARCPRGGSERTARPREIQTEAGNGENPEHGGKGKTSARGPSARGVPPPGPDNSDGSQPRERLRETSGTKPTCAVCLDFFRWPVMLLAQKLTSLKAQPQKLISLKAQPQKLTSLKARPQKLISLKTRPQKLISLKARPQKLTSLKARPQKLISLKAQPPKLTSLKARPQKLTSLKAQPQILPSHHGAKPSAFPPGIRERKLG
ncbi:protein piccolo-like isoform X8 [Anser cygnoides]|uniref:protein piccolo-like isoform X8 n=1 Tax=Anser cygnoides TaxID=8845 RepID=UPI0034D3691F